MFEQYYYNPMDYNQLPMSNRNSVSGNDPEDFDGCISSIVYTLAWIIVILISLFISCEP